MKEIDIYRERERKEIENKCPPYVLKVNPPRPIAPSFTEDFFAKQSNGNIDIHCSDYKDKDTEPQCCKDASSKASFYQIVCDSIAALFTFTVAPIVGQYSDAYGRMPYILPASCVIGLPSISLLLCDLGIFGLEPYYTVTMFSPLYLSLSLVMSYVADVLEPQNRGTGFALVLGGFGLGLATAPSISLFLSRRNTLILGTFMSVLCPPYVLKVNPPRPIRLI